MTFRLRTIALCLLTTLSLTACVVAPPRHARVVEVVAVDTRPPPLRVVEVPPPRRGYVWVPGYWRWSGREHVWVEGYFVRERRGWHWEPAHWDERQGRWYFTPGLWVRG